MRISLLQSFGVGIHEIQDLFSPLKHLLIHFCIAIQRLAAVETPADKAVFHVIQSVKQLWVMFAVDSILDPHTAKKEPRLLSRLRAVRRQRSSFSISGTIE